MLSKQWRTFCNFHLGNYKEALNDYRDLKAQSTDDVLAMNIAICMFYLGKITTFTSFTFRSKVFQISHNNRYYFLNLEYNRIEVFIPCVVNPIICLFVGQFTQGPEHLHFFHILFLF